MHARKLIRPAICSALFLCLTLCAGAQEGKISISLQDCLKEAENNSVEIKNARLDFLQAKATKSEVWQMWLPQVSINAGGYYALKPLLRVDLQDILGTTTWGMTLADIITTAASEMGIKPYYANLQKGYMVGVGALQPIFTGGRLLNANKLASVGVEAAELRRGMATRTTRDSVETKYLRILSLQEKFAVVNAARALLDTLEKDVNCGVESGVMTQGELLEVRLHKSELNQRELLLKRGLKLLKMDLFNTAGMPWSYSLLDKYCLSEEGLVSTEKPPKDYIVPEEEAVDCYESRLLDLLVESKRLEKKIAVGSSLPQIGAGFSYGYSNLIERHTGRFNGVGFVTLQIPITGAITNAQRIRKSDYELEKALNTQEYATAQLRLQLQMLQVEMETAWDCLQNAAEAETLCRETVRKMQAGFDAGTVAMNELLKGQLDLQEASCKTADARAEYRKAIRRYLLRISL